MGIAQWRLICMGYGANNPIADNATEEGQARNRRVEFVLLPEVDGPS
jgi:outer membrane protein OmpA-like peptidoglycan-associated protein